MEVKFDIDNFYFHHHAEVVVLERLENGISSHVRPLTHEPLN